MKRVESSMLSGLLCLIMAVMVLVLACKPSTTPTSASAPSVTSKPTVAPTSTPSPTPSPTPKSTAMAAPVSFAGKTITIVTPTAAGGSTDMQTRILAKYLGKYLSGNPSVVVRSIPGGQNTIGMNYAYASKPDGMTLMSYGGTPQTLFMLGSSAVKYDLTKISIVMASQGAITSVVYMKSGVIDKPEGIPKAEPLVFGGSAGISTTVFLLAKEFIEIPTKKVTMAYGGTAESRRAFLAGEVNITGETSPGYLQAMVPYVRKGEVMPLFQSGVLEKGDVVRHAGLPDLQTVKELYGKIYGKSPSGIEWDAFKMMLTGGITYNPVLALPPNPPDTILRAYWGAAEKMANDPEFRKDLAFLEGGDSWGAGESVDKEYRLSYKVNPDVVAWVKSTLTKKYDIVFD